MDDETLIIEPKTLNTQQRIAEWECPVPLTRALAPHAPYPTEALPSIVKKAVSAYQTYGQQPLPLIACSALANI